MAVALPMGGCHGIETASARSLASAFGRPANALQLRPPDHSHLYSCSYSCCHHSARMHRHAAQRSVSRAGAAHLVQVAGRAGGDVARAEDDLLGHAPAHEHVQVREQLPPRDARLVRLWQLHHHAQRHACAAPRARLATGRRASYYASAACTPCPAAPHKASQTLVSTFVNTGNAAYTGW